MGRPATITRDALLHAAEAVVLEAGAGHLTLDAVAAKAGVSKGGLLHTFRTKDALIQAMLERLISQADAAIEAQKGRLAGQPNAAIRSYLVGSFETDDVDPATAMGLLAAVAENPKLLEPVRAFYRTRLAEILAEAEDETGALMIWLAAEGMLLLGLLGVSPLSEEQRASVLARLTDLAGEER